MKPRLAWITLSRKRSGGFQYGAWVREKLSPFFEVELQDVSFHSIDVKALKPVLWALGLISLWFKKPRDVWIRDFIMAGIVPLWTRKKNIFLIHHIDPSVWPWWARTMYRLLEGYIYSNLRGADAVVVISRYWERHFRERGFARVYKIYNCFPVEEYRVSDEEVERFKKEFQLEGKPIVYLGNCEREKGVVEAYEALKDLDVYLVTSGEELVKIPARNLNLTRRNFLCLLKATDVAVFMTRFRTGWDMTACEAMLFKTPVIGTSIAAMQELLESSGQTICDDFGALKQKVEYLLSHPEAKKAQGERGYKFVRQFSLGKLQREWQAVIQEVISK
ncbi:MAG: glycosyltransferase [Parcubacteria group bacterium]|nr:glycosyltransferase [Parcubacteria group bacterium]